MLTRLGVGALSLYIVAQSPLLPSSFNLFDAERMINFGDLPLAILWTLLSLVSGAIVIMLGTLGTSKRATEKARVLRAYRVGQTGNPLLQNLLKDAHQKLEIAFGCMGLLYVLLLTGGLSLFVLESIAMAEYEARLDTTEPITVAVAGGIAGLSGVLLQRSVISSIEAIDYVLDRFSPLDLDQ